jgi:hypothetical protein
MSSTRLLDDPITTALGAFSHQGALEQPNPPEEPETYASSAFA